VCAHETLELESRGSVWEGHRPVRKELQCPGEKCFNLSVLKSLRTETYSRKTREGFVFMLSCNE
jgi:hypothetical protein